MPFFLFDQGDLGRWLVLWTVLGPTRATISGCPQVQAGAVSRMIMCMILFRFRYVMIMLETGLMMDTYHGMMIDNPWIFLLAELIGTILVPQS